MSTNIFLFSHNFNLNLKLNKNLLVTGERTSVKLFTACIATDIFNYSGTSLLRPIMVRSHLPKNSIKPNVNLYWCLSLSSINTSTQFYKSHFCRSLYQSRWTVCPLVCQNFLAVKKKALFKWDHGLK